MKKLMIVAAAVAIAAVAEAGITVNTNCNPRSATCPVVAFKVTASGKIAAPVEKKGEVYTTATKLQIKKGALILFPTQGGSADDCCYDNYSLYLQVKVNKDTVPVGVFFEETDSWTIFGKNYNKTLEASKSKKFKVESELGLSYAVATSSNGGIATGGSGTDTVTDASGLSIDLGAGLGDFAFIATAFGKGTYAYSLKMNKCSACTVDSETYEFTPGNYSGWFAGLISNLGGDYGCLMCSCYGIDVFGGTWKAKYNKTWSANANGWQQAAAWVFGAGVVADMKEAEIE